MRCRQSTLQMAASLIRSMKNKNGVLHEKEKQARDTRVRALHGSDHRDAQLCGTDSTGNAGHLQFQPWYPAIF